MTPFPEALAKVLRPRFDDLTQSLISAILIEFSGKANRSEALRTCPGVSNPTRLSGGVYGRPVPFRRVGRDSRMHVGNQSVSN